MWKTALVFVITSNLWVLSYRWIDPPITFVMMGKYFSDERDEKILDFVWADRDDIAGNLQLAAICSEDQTFLEHNGFELDAIRKALKERKQGKKLRGASTISQQVAKNTFLWSGRSWVRKGLEVYFTALVELYWPKSRILEVYLNVVELGPNVYGASEAARIYFKKKPSQLSRNEAALVVVALPNPIKYRLSRPSGYMLKRQGWVLRQMQNFGGTAYLEEMQ